MFCGFSLLDVGALAAKLWIKRYKRQKGDKRKSCFYMLMLPCQQIQILWRFKY